MVKQWPGPGRLCGLVGLGTNVGTVAERWRNGCGTVAGAWGSFVARYGLEPMFMKETRA